MNNIIFRKSIKEDMPFINDLFIEMVKTVNERMVKDGKTPYEGFDNGFEKGYLDTFYVNDDRVIFVALDDKKVIGFISICNEKDFIYLDDFSVSKDYQGKNVGTTLIKMAFDFANDINIKMVVTHVESANKQSLEFYKKKGFVIAKKEGDRLLIKKKLN